MKMTHHRGAKFHNRVSFNMEPHMAGTIIGQVLVPTLFEGVSNRPYLAERLVNRMRTTAFHETQIRKGFRQR